MNNGNAACCRRTAVERRASALAEMLASRCTRCRLRTVFRYRPEAFSMLFPSLWLATRLPKKSRYGMLKQQRPEAEAEGRKCGRSQQKSALGRLQENLLGPDRDQFGNLGRDHIH